MSLTRERIVLGSRFVTLKYLRSKTYDGKYWVPADIDIRVPHLSKVAPEKRHLLAYIPWNEKYIAEVPIAYRDFFRYALRFLHVRTTDVHTAFSVAMAEKLINETSELVDERLVYLAVILHDTGWTQLEEHDIANSLDYSSLFHSEQAMKPKEQHATLGAQMALKILQAYKGGDLEVTAKEEQAISDFVYYHDLIRIWDAQKMGREAPIEYWLVVDADRLWSYTHENFWLDTIRKDVPPKQYVRNLEKAIDEYMLTPQGNKIARELIAERKKEVRLMTKELLAA